MPAHQTTTCESPLFIRSRLLLLSVAVACLSVPLLYPFFDIDDPQPGWMLSRMMSAFKGKEQRPTRMPVYFLGIGGPNSLSQPNHPAALQLAETGEEITAKVKPKAIVVFSAHWQHGRDKVAINTAEDPGLIYDFFGFPKSYYEIEYPYRGSTEVANKVVEKLASTGIKVDRVERGLDHGVWVGFLSAFDPKKNPLDVPIVQVSLFDNEDLAAHYRLGQALATLRDEGVLIIGAGMVVHNLQDFRKRYVSGDFNVPMPYTSEFESSVTKAIATKPEDRQMAMEDLLKRKGGRDAHPSLEHILPMYVAAGAAGADRGERIWALPEASLNWGQYRFGRVPSAA